MCRPSCCKPRSQAPGVAAVALIIGAGIIAVHKISHVLAQIAHEVINVLLLIALRDRGCRRGRSRGLGHVPAGVLVAAPPEGTPPGQARSILASSGRPQ